MRRYDIYLFSYHQYKTKTIIVSYLLYFCLLYKHVSIVTLKQWNTESQSRLQLAVMPAKCARNSGKLRMLYKLR